MLALSAAAMELHTPFPATQAYRSTDQDGKRRGRCNLLIDTPFSPHSPYSSPTIQVRIGSGEQANRACESAHTSHAHRTQGSARAPPRAFGASDGEDRENAWSAAPRSRSPSPSWRQDVASSRSEAAAAHASRSRRSTLADRGTCRGSSDHGQSSQRRSRTPLSDPRTRHPSNRRRSGTHRESTYRGQSNRAAAPIQQQR